MKVNVHEVESGESERVEYQFFEVEYLQQEKPNEGDARAQTRSGEHKYDPQVPKEAQAYCSSNI